MHLRLGVEGLRDDRLALRLADRPGGGDRARRARSRATRRRTSRRSRRRRRSPRSIGSQAPVTAMLDEYRKRARSAARVADAPIRGCAAASRPARSTCSSTSATCCRPTGFRTSLDFADALLEESRVAVTPGEAFDAPGTIRISYATSMETARGGQPRACSSSSRKHAPQTATAELKKQPRRSPRRARDAFLCDLRALRG